jgi:hypothetical protein
MQKVVGSSPISRFGLTLQIAGFSFLRPNDASITAGLLVTNW